MKPTRRGEVYIDGSSLGNPGPAGIGVVFVDGGGTPARQFGKPIGEMTNNVAEYTALLYALQDALILGYRSVTIKTDSELLARQLSGAYRVREAHLRLLHDLARHLMRGFVQCRILHVPRAANRLADRLARAAAKSQQETFASHR